MKDGFNEWVEKKGIKKILESDDSAKVIELKNTYVTDIDTYIKSIADGTTNNALITDHKNYWEKLYLTPVVEEMLSGFISQTMFADAFNKADLIDDIGSEDTKKIARKVFNAIRESSIDEFKDEINAAILAIQVGLIIRAKFLMECKDTTDSGYIWLHRPEDGSEHDKLLALMVAAVEITGMTEDNFFNKISELGIV